MNETKTIERWLATAPAEGVDCPPPELFLPTEWADLDSAARTRAERHVAGCPACAAESELATAFEAEPLPTLRAETEVRAILDRVAASDSKSAAGRRVLGFPSRIPRVPQPLVTLAAAAALVAAVSLVVRHSVAPPGLPDVPLEDVMRSGRIEATSPIGDVAAPPATLVWAGVDGAATYRVTISTVDETVLWSAIARAPSLPLPASVRSRLRARVIYSWKVEAFDAAGARLAWSPLTQFRSLTEAAEVPR